MKKIAIVLFVFVLCLSGFAQTITLKFTGRDVQGHYCQLNYVNVTNLSKNWQETISWPDTTLVLNNEVDIDDYIVLPSFKLSQNVPNPFVGITDVSLDVVGNEDVFVEVADMSGKTVLCKNIAKPQAGAYVFHVELSTPQTYVLTARQGKNFASIKMVNHGAGGENAITVLQCIDGKQVAKTNKDAKSNVTHPWANGDNLSVEGYATIDGTEFSQSLSMLLLQNETVTIVFPVSASSDGQPCPGSPTVTDIDNNIYNTVQLGNQCWMKENLRTTRYADGTAILMGPGLSTTVPYRYAPDNETNNVAFYGYLYNWAAVMHGANSSSNNPSGVQGICPNGWHVPSDAEWAQLITYVSSQSQYFCNNNSNRIAKALASTTGWNSDSSPCAVGNNQSTNNATGFSAMPAGYCHGEYGENNYFSFGGSTSFWCATSSPVHNDMANYYGLNYFENYVIGNYTEKIDGISVRCVRD